MELHHQTTPPNAVVVVIVEGVLRTRSVDRIIGRLECAIFRIQAETLLDRSAFDVLCRNNIVGEVDYPVGDLSWTSLSDVLP
jgi:hypothetical protein